MCRGVYFDCNVSMSTRKPQTILFKQTLCNQSYNLYEFFNRNLFLGQWLKILVKRQTAHSIVLFSIHLQFLHALSLVICHMFYPEDHYINLAVGGIANK